MQVEPALVSVLDSHGGSRLLSVARPRPSVCAAIGSNMSNSRNGRIGKVRSEPACRASVQLPSDIDRAARGMPRANCQSQESRLLELYTVCYVCIRDRLGGCNLDSRSRRFSEPSAAEAWALVVRWDSAVSVLDGAVVWCGVRPRKRRWESENRPGWHFGLIADGCE